MINLIGTSPRTAAATIGVHAYREYCGLLTSPKSAQNPAYAAALGAAWAMDNDAFTGFQAQPFLHRLTQWRYAPGCRFVVAPDVVQDATKTLAGFWIWQPVIHAFKLPVAFVLQNGMHEHRIPWEYMDALFIGGSTDFKYTRYVGAQVAEAKRRGKWVHNGRVNSRQRIHHSRAIGCDSFDGTGYAIEPARIKSELPWWTTASTNDIQFALWEAA